MHRLSLAFILTGCFVYAASPFAGRWDVVVTTSAEKYPGWLEVVENGSDVKVRAQPPTGHVRVGTNVKLEGSHLSLTLGDSKIDWDLTASNGQIKGTMKHNTETGTIAGVRAPDLKRPMPAAWTNPEPLFNGKDLSGWEPFKGTNQWVAQDGTLLNKEHGADLRTVRKFDDFKLHFEVNCPDPSNSGFYLRGRYEIQIAYEKNIPDERTMGSIYGYLAPAVMLPRTPGSWETFDATLVGRTLTLVRNGVTIQDKKELAGITGGALDPNEGEPGPFYIQGDHTGGMKYRNITISVPKR